MKPELMRFGVAMDRSLLEAFDALVEARATTRSEVLRDLVRAEIERNRLTHGGPAIGSLTLVYNHHVRELAERLTEMQHELGEQVRATLHIHLDHDRCMEVIVMRGNARELQTAAGKILSTRGVSVGGMELISDPAGQRIDGAHSHPAGDAGGNHHHHPRAAARTRAQPTQGTRPRSRKRKSA